MQNFITIEVLFAITSLIIGFSGAYVAIVRLLKTNSIDTRKGIEDSFKHSMKSLEDNINIRLTGIEEHINTKIEDIKKDVSETRVDMRDMKTDFKEVIKENDVKAHKRIDEVVSRVFLLEQKSK
jgi:hypothetical protein